MKKVKIMISGPLVLIFISIHGENIVFQILLTHPSRAQLLSFFFSLRRRFKREEGTAGGDPEDGDPGHGRQFSADAAQAEPRSPGGPGGARRPGRRPGGKAGGAPVPRASLLAHSDPAVGALARERGEERHAPSRRAAFKFVV